MAGPGQIGPDLGFHQDADAGLEVIQKTPHRRRRVPGLPALHVARLQQAGTLQPAGGGAMGEQQAHARQSLAQARQQRRSGAGFAQRYGMHPDGIAIARPGLSGIVSKALRHGLQVARLHLAPARELAAHQRLHQPHQQGIQQAGHADLAPADTLDQACQTASTDGADWANTLHWCADPSGGPVRQAVSKL